MAAIELLNPNSLQFNTQEKIYHGGIELEKGVVITPYFLEKNQDFFQECFQIFSVYPDVFLDLITPGNTTFTLFPYQRILLRPVLRQKLFFRYLQSIFNVYSYQTMLVLLLRQIKARPRKSVNKRFKRFGAFGLYLKMSQNQV